MKKYLRKIGVLMIAGMVMVSCGKSSDKSKDKEKSTSALSKIKETRKAVKAYSGMASSAKQMMEDTQKLAEMDPVDQAELKEWLPRQLKNYKRTYYSSGDMSMMGVASFKSTFTDEEEDSKKVSIELIDGAGSLAGSMIATYKRKFESGLEEESNSGYKRVLKKNGYHAYEEQNDQRTTALIEFIHDDRFYVKLEGEKMTADELWDISKELPFKALSKL